MTLDVTHVRAPRPIAATAIATVEQMQAKRGMMNPVTARIATPSRAMARPRKNQCSTVVAGGEVEATMRAGGSGPGPHAPGLTHRPTDIQELLATRLNIPAASTTKAAAT